MSNKGSIAGRVVDATGQPVPGVSVAISESPQPHSDIAALTNADGRFRLSGLLPGPYTIAAHRGQAAGGAHVTVAAGQQAEIEMLLDG